MIIADAFLQFFTCRKEFTVGIASAAAPCAPGTRRGRELQRIRRTKTRRRLEAQKISSRELLARSILKKSDGIKCTSLDLICHFIDCGVARIKENELQPPAQQKYAVRPNQSASAPGPAKTTNIPWPRRLISFGKLSPLN